MHIQFAASLPDLALKASTTQFPTRAPLPAHPTTIEHAEYPKAASMFLRALSNPMMEVPLCYLSSANVDEGMFEPIDATLANWISQSLDILSSKVFFKSEHLPKGALLAIVRALGFVQGRALPRSLPSHDLYHRCYATIACISIHKWSSLVLFPIADHLVRTARVRKRSTYVVLALEAMHKALAEWTVFSAHELPNLLQVLSSSVRLK